MTVPISAETATPTEEPRLDGATIRAAADGDDAARKLVVGLILQRTRNTARYLTRNRADADDLAQAALIEVLCSLGNFRGEGSFAGWANRVAVRTMIRQLNREQRRWRGRADDEEYSDPGPTLSSTAEASELRGKMANHLGALKEKKRVALVLKYVHGYSIKDIAEITETPVETVRARLRVGKRELAARLRRDPAFEERLESLDDHAS